jgi:Insertion element 4 transposase N-terminal/Transposase DDE domain
LDTKSVITSVVTRTITVAGGRFAPGHLGELTQLLPFEMVDAALTATRAVQARVRALPSRVVVYLLLAACLFPEIGYPGVWGKLTAALTGPTGLDCATPTPAGLAQARRRVGPAPLRWLFDLLRGPAAGRQPGVRWHDLLVCAIDGTVLTVPDTPAMATRWSKQRGNHGGTGYPQIRLVALLACGTRTVLDAVWGATTTGETTYARQLLPSLHPGMMLLADRNFAVATLLNDIAATGAAFLVRIKNGRKTPILARYPDGSYLSVLAGIPGGVRVRVIDCEITIATPTGRRTGLYRLVTSLHDHQHYPASELITLYHQRWEIETAYLELKTSILGGRVLRARTPTGIEQEVYALLLTYQLLRTAIADATATRPGTDPDRGSFTVAWQTARDQLVQAADVIATTIVDLAGTIGRHVLAHLLPDRRLRVSPRIVKRAISKYQARGPKIDRTSYQATLTVNVLSPPDP